MDLGVHLPVLTWSESEPATPSLIAYVETARRLGFTAVSVNDHVQHRRPWLDGPTALASVVSATGDMTLATTIALAVVRGPIALAKSLGAIDLLSGGRLVVGVGPGSYAPDYKAAGLAWDEHWPRFEEAIRALRALWHPDGEPFEGTFYSTRGIRLEPPPAQDGGPPIWVGSWGSDAGLRRVARLGDGWIASAYNTTPEGFTESWDRLRRQLPLHGKDPETFPNAPPCSSESRTTRRAPAASWRSGWRPRSGGPPWSSANGCWSRRRRRARSVSPATRRRAFSACSSGRSEIRSSSSSSSASGWLRCSISDDREVIRPVPD